MIDGFLIKKIVSMLVHLIPGALIVLLILLMAQRWWPRLCRALAIFVCCVLIGGSVPPISNYFVAALEDQFPILQKAPPDTALILVLGLGHMYTEDRPPNSVLMAAALSRLAEGVRLWKTQPESYLALSGAKFRSSISHASAMQKMAIELGVPAQRIVRFDRTRDTQEEIITALATIDNLPLDDAASLQPKNERSRLVVASSATHLPRAALMLEDRGALYSMAPTDFRTIDAPWYRPQASFLRNLDGAVHEWVGMLWYRLSRG